MAVVIALAAATAAVWRLSRRKPVDEYRELTLRVRTWWMIVVLFGVAVLLNRVGVLVFFGCVSVLALREYFSLVPPRAGRWPILLWAYLSIPLQYYWIHLEWYGMFIIFIPVYLFLLLPTRLVLAGVTEGFIQSAGVLHWGLMTTVFSISHAAYLLVLEPGSAPRWEPHWSFGASAASAGAGLLLFLVLLTELNDIFQYMWGKSFGRIRIAPQVSPRKTLAGFLGGVATTTALAALVGPLLTFMDWRASMLAGLVIGLAGFAGDLSVSAIKRDLGVKDSGTTLPGHGGILDRIDSLTYTAPLFFHYVWYFYG
ncbi:MAG TPA: phosphatidate cytidylyltransferase [Lacipirellulaceae bacterium]|nr:phosphatidate cytidylyltransferase [Lacipirellulaceae bacterium]